MKHEIEVVCQAEQRTVGVFTTDGVMDAKAISGVRRRDPGRFPVKVEDGVPMRCMHCQTSLQFRDVDGATYVAVPGYLEILEDPAERERRQAEFKKTTVEEADDKNRQLYEAKEARRG